MDTSNKGAKAKTVATIDVNIHWPKLEKRSWIEESVEDHLQCILCGNNLLFKHKTDFVAQVVSEVATCPTCNVRHRESHNILH